MQLHKISRRTNNVLHVKCFFFFNIYFIPGPAVIGHSAVAVSLPNVYILIVTYLFSLVLLFVCLFVFCYNNAKANKIK